MTKSYQIGQELRESIRNERIEEQEPLTAKVKLLLRYGILAPSTHNTQPWQFEITDKKLKIYIDFRKSVPAADPTTRDMYISTGALIKNIVLAAKEFGVEPVVTYPKMLTKSDLVATVTFNNLPRAKSPKISKILDGILKRQNYRGFFSKEFDKSNFDNTRQAVLSSQNLVKAKVVTSAQEVEKLAKLTAKGLSLGYSMPTFRHEIGGLINHNLSRKQYGLHGYSLRLSTPQSFIIPSLMKHKDLGPKLSQLNYKSFILSPAVMVLATKKDDEASWLATGQVMEELMVRLASDGLATSLYTASIEMKGLRGELMGILDMDKQLLPQVLFCIGTPGKPLPYSVRKDLTSLIR